MELLHKNITAAILQSFFNVAQALPFLWAEQIFLHQRFDKRFAKSRFSCSSK